jgi:hypothetical protein
MDACGTNCPCKFRLRRASEALAQASRLLQDSIWADTDGEMETAFAVLRDRSAKFKGALLDFRDHQTEIAQFQATAVQIGAELAMGVLI